MLKANIPTNVATVMLEINGRPDTPCPKFPDDESRAHCHCSSREHTCGFCGEVWH